MRDFSPLVGAEKADVQSAVSDGDRPHFVDHIGFQCGLDRSRREKRGPDSEADHLGGVTMQIVSRCSPTRLSWQITRGPVSELSVDAPFPELGKDDSNEWVPVAILEIRHLECNAPGEPSALSRSSPPPLSKSNPH